MAKNVQNAVRLSLALFATTCSTAAIAAPAQAQLKTVVVTAEKRVQNIQKIGESITAISGRDLNTLGIVKPIDLAQQTPGLVTANTLGTGSPSFVIRGVGLADFNTNTNPGVAVYIDSLYQPIPAALTFGMFDIHRVEVLKGPQGTLYGADATGGAINIITNKPTNHFGGYVHADYGSYDYSHFEGAVGGPITDWLDGRLSGTVTHQGEGFQKVIAVGKTGTVGHLGKVDTYALRGQLKAQLGDDIDALLEYTYGRDTSQNHNPSFLSKRALTYTQAYYYTYYHGPVCYNCVLLTDSKDRPHVDNTENSVGLTVNWNLDFATLTSITGYQHLDHVNSSNATAGEVLAQYLDYGGRVTQVSEEARLTSNKGGLVDWILGVYYSDATQHNSSLGILNYGVGYVTALLGYSTLGNNVSADGVLYQDLRDVGVFAHTGWHLTDKLDLIVGARFSNDVLNYSTESLDTSAPGTGPTGYPISDLLNLLDVGGVTNRGKIISSGSGNDPKDNVSWKVGLNYNATKNLLLYANIATGFKNQGFFGGVAATSSMLAPYRPEKLTAYEAGFKSNLLNHQAQLDGAVFFDQYKNQQIIYSADIGLGTPNDILTNVAESKIYGAETNLLWAPSDELLFQLGMSYLHTAITNPQVTSLLPAYAPVGKGKPLAYAPDFSVNGMITYNVPITQSLEAKLETGFNWRDTVLSYAGVTRDAYGVRDRVLPSRFLLNARVGIGPSGGKWEVSLWAKNITDSKYPTYSYELPAGAIVGYEGPPPTFGVSVDYKFGRN